jgi:hypothetical protein
MLFLIILILSFAGGYFLPWWVIAIAAFIAAYFAGKKPLRSFFAGFFAVFIAWIVLALFKSIPNDHILDKRVAHLFQLPNWLWILLLTGFIGGLVGGMSALSGILLRKAFTKG